MDVMRKTMGVLFVMLGAYYCVLSVFTLVTLSSVTTTWIERSGDRDFKHDYRIFMACIAVGAMLVGVFGYRTVIKGISAARGRRESWLALAIGAPLLHWFWFLFRIIGNGVLDRNAQASAMRANGLQLGAICLAYVAMWLLMRRGHATKHSTTNNLHPTTAAGR